MNADGSGWSDAASYPDVDSASPWIAQMEPDGPPRPLSSDLQTEVVIVGAGIAGVATAFFTLRSTSHRVVLIERERVARGASGSNAGQLTTYFERPLASIADEFGPELAVSAQQSLDDAHDLLDLIAAESGATVRVERFTGHMGMYNLKQLLVHLRNNLIRLEGGIATETCVVSEDAEFLDQIPAEFLAVYSVVPQARIHELLETDDPIYRAVLSDRKGCANSGALVQQVLAYLERTYSDRLTYVDKTRVERVIVGSDGVRVHANSHVVTTERIVMCTNGFSDHVVEDESGEPILLPPHQRVGGVIGYMAAFVEKQMRTPTAMSYIRNEVIGGDSPYVYVTRRTYDRPDDVVTLTCMGGPEGPFPGKVYDPAAPYPGSMLTYMDDVLRPFAQPARPGGEPYEFHWHGLMGYSDGMIRVVGAHREQPRVLYNMGCNGIGFLPSLFGADRVSRILAGEALAPSIFDPR